MEWWHELEGQNKAFLCLTGVLVAGLVAIHFLFMPLFRKQDKELREYNERT